MYPRHPAVAAAAGPELGRGRGVGRVVGLGPADGAVLPRPGDPRGTGPSGAGARRGRGAGQHALPDVPRSLGDRLLPELHRPVELRGPRRDPCAEHLRPRDRRTRGVPVRGPVHDHGAGHPARHGNAHGTRLHQRRAVDGAAACRARDRDLHRPHVHLLLRGGLRHHASGCRCRLCGRLDLAFGAGGDRRGCGPGRDRDVRDPVRIRLLPGTAVDRSGEARSGRKRYRAPAGLRPGPGLGKRRLAVPAPGAGTLPAGQRTRPV